MTSLLRMNPARRSMENLSRIVSARHVLASVFECEEEFVDVSEVRIRWCARYRAGPPPRQQHTGRPKARPPRPVRVVEMIARIKILGMRAANSGTLRMAARAVVSYLQGRGEAGADTKQRSSSLA